MPGRLSALGYTAVEERSFQYPLHSYELVCVDDGLQPHGSPRFGLARCGIPRVVRAEPPGGDYSHCSGCICRTQCLHFNHALRWIGRRCGRIGIGNLRCSQYHSGSRSGSSPTRSTLPSPRGTKGLGWDIGRTQIDSPTSIDLLHFPLAIAQRSLRILLSYGFHANIVGCTLLRSCTAHGRRRCNANDDQHDQNHQKGNSTGITSRCNENSGCTHDLGIHHQNAILDRRVAVVK